MELAAGKLRSLVFTSVKALRESKSMDEAWTTTSTWRPSGMWLGSLWPLPPMTASLNILVNVRGGGINGQAGAIRHGIARALVELDENNRPSLKANGYLTRDARMVERKKYGRPGAPQEVPILEGVSVFFNAVCGPH